MMVELPSSSAVRSSGTLPSRPLPRLRLHLHLPRTCTRTCTYTHAAHLDANPHTRRPWPKPEPEPELRQSGDGRGLTEDTRNEVNGVHVPEVDIGVQHFFDLVFHLAAGEDAAAGRSVVVCGFDEDSGDELNSRTRK